MEIILCLLAGIAIGAFIGWLLGKSNGRTEWEKKVASIQQQYTDMEKEFVSYRATQAALLASLQQQLQVKAEELVVSQRSVKESQDKFFESAELLAGIRAELQAANQKVEDKQQEGEALKEELRSIKQELSTSSQRLASQTANNESLLERLITQKQEIEALNKKFNLEFENIANRILDTKTEKFTELNKANLNLILEPLGKNITEFKTKVEEVYQKESEQRFSLGERV